MVRIGDFAEANALSIDTVRYYVDMNLIHPIRKGRYFYFDSQQQEELNRLVSLKKMRFSLEEIKRIATVQELSRIKTPVQSTIYQEMLLSKREELEKEVTCLIQALNNLESEIGQLNECRQEIIRERGLAFSLIDFLSCPKCGKDIEMANGTLKGNGIYDGKSECSCGYILSVSQGILITKHDSHNIIEPYQDNQNYIDSFAREAPKDFVDFMMNACKDIIRMLLENELSDKVLLFMKSGLGILETKLLELSCNPKLLILVDDDFNKLKIAKKSIESRFPSSNTLYICSELNELPLKETTIDQAVDFMATFINGFRTDCNMYSHINKLLKQKSIIILQHLYFKSFKMLSRLPENRRRLFDGRTIPQYLHEKGFKQVGSFEELILQEGSNINDFFKDGDKVNTQLLVFERHSY